MVGLIERWVMKVAEVGLDRDVGMMIGKGGVALVIQYMCVCVGGWVDVCLSDGGSGFRGEC